MIVEPYVSGDGFLHLSDPIPFAAADYDGDRDVDEDDTAFFMDCMNGPDSHGLHPLCTHVDANEDGAIDLKEFATLQQCYSGGAPANPECGK